MNFPPSSLSFDSSGIIYDTAPPPARRADSGADFSQYFSSFSAPPASPTAPPSRDTNLSFNQDYSTENPPANNEATMEEGSAGCADSVAGEEQNEPGAGSLGNAATPSPASTGKTRSASQATTGKKTTQPSAAATVARTDAGANASILIASPSPASGFQSPLQGDKADLKKESDLGFSIPTGKIRFPRAATTASGIKSEIAAVGDGTASGDDSTAGIPMGPISAETPKLAADPDLISGPVAAAENVAAATADAPLQLPTEKNALSAAGPGDGSKSNRKGISENFLTADQEQLTKHETLVGIDVAKPAPVMPFAEKFNASLSSANADTLTVAPAASDSSFSTSSQSDNTHTSVQEVAQRAVDAVMSVADLAATRQQHAVNLQFSVGGTPLEVRVEMKSGDVHTTFRTDSSDLRAALADAWQTTAGERGATARLVPPVFSAGSSSFLNSSLGGNQSQQQRQSQQSTPAFSTTTFGTSAKNSAEAGEPALSAPSSPVSLLTTLHLHTFA